LKQVVDHPTNYVHSIQSGGEEKERTEDKKYLFFENALLKRNFSTELSSSFFLIDASKEKKLFHPLAKAFQSELTCPLFFLGLFLNDVINSLLYSRMRFEALSKKFFFPVEKNTKCKKYKVQSDSQDMGPLLF
jgi:hypothetical protein